MAKDYLAHQQTLALFIDFENLALGVRDEGAKLNMRLILDRLVEKGKVLVKRAYCDWTRFSEYKQRLQELGIDLIEIPQRRIGGKNSADIRLVVDAMEVCYEKSHLDVFVVASGDSDFSPLVSKLRENNKAVIGCGVKSSTSNLLVENCDEFIFYDDLVRSTKKTKGDTRSLPDRLSKLPKQKRAAFGHLIDAIEALIRENKQVLWGSMIKETIKRKRPSFNESFHGYSTFSRLLEDAQRQNLVQLKRDEVSGGYIVVALADDI
ncbi:NYN domain-containing protein [Planctomycetota bacterium]